MIHLQSINKLLLKVFLLSFSVTCTTASVMAQTADVSSFLKDKMQKLGIPGMQVAIVQRGKIILNQSFGIANLQETLTVTSKSIFPINSCTKVFTGVAIMQLVEEDKIDLSAPISHYLDSLPESWKPITIRQLLTHISGLPDIMSVLDPFSGGFGSLGNEATAWAKITAKPMDFTTGTQFSYNQTNYLLLGKIIEKLRGQPFTQVFKERQFQVVSMPNTVFGDSRDVIPHIVPSYRFTRNIDGNTLQEPKLTNTYVEFVPALRTGSGLNSTAEDLANWIIALQQGKLIKTKSTLNTMWTAGTFNNGSPTIWALGWGVNKFRTHHKAVGMSGGGRSAFLIYPDDDLAIIVLTNLAGSYPESFIDEIAGYYNPEIPASDPVAQLRAQIPKAGFEHTAKVYKELKKKDPNFKPDESDLNNWGYQIMRGGQIKNALEIFKLTVSINPESWNAYDSYGEALLKAKKKEEAISMYRKSIELNPENKGGKKILAELLQ
ncbi:class A beta-lactamase-related serine hydrolase [Pedobacter sp. PAMC26386]|nr:class A beta-lactamase-related serine hydrolase [Pedobacter sp. PAMC26386]